MSTPLKALPAGFSDDLGRKVSYLRLSITDRCNFRCAYCRGDSFSHIPHQKIASYEDFLRLSQIAAHLGVEKIRVTGGEPFARPDCVKFIASLRQRLPDTRLCITTNGSLLEPHIPELARLKLGSLNISLDTFDAEAFKKITGSDSHAVILNNIDRLLQAGMSVKINAVALRGITDRQMDDFIHAAKNLGIDIRFIEFMPMGKCTKWSEGQFIPASEILRIAMEKVKLAEVPGKPAAHSGPARMYQIEGSKGRLGFITPLSQHFCSACNRLRVTSEGNLRLCLFADKEFRLLPMLRDPRIPDAAIEKAMARALLHKPLGADLLAAKMGNAVALRHMDGIGG